MKIKRENMGTVIGGGGHDKVMEKGRERWSWGGKESDKGRGRSFLTAK